MLNIKKNDQIVVIAGKDKGKTGKVLKVFPKQNRLIVEHSKPADHRTIISESSITVKLYEIGGHHTDVVEGVRSFGVT